MHGNLSAPLELNKVQFTEDLRVGDLVVTAGIRIGRDARSQFPRDLVIGSIVSVDRDPASTTITALVQPAADLDGLELVLVVMDYHPDPLPGATPIPTPEPDAAVASGDPAPDATRKPRRTPKPGR